LWERGQLAAALNDLTDPTQPGKQQLRTSSPSRAVRRRSMRGRRGLGGTTVDLSPRARDFLVASIRTDRRRRTRGTTILTVLLITALTAAVVAVIQQQSAQEQLRVATARQLLAQAELIATSDPRGSGSLALAAHSLYPGQQTDAALFRHLVGSHILASLTGHTQGVSSVAFSGDGHTLATGSWDDTVILWDVTTPTQPTRVGEPLDVRTRPVLSVAFSGDGRTLATGSYDGTVILWDVTTPTRPTRIETLTGTAGPVTVVFSPDGHTLATGHLTVILWDVTDPTRPSGSGHPSPAPPVHPGRCSARMDTSWPPAMMCPSKAR